MPDFATFSAEVQELYQEPQKRRRTAQKVRQVLRELQPHCRTTDDLGPLAIARWLADYPDRTPATRRSLLATLRAICGYADWRQYAAEPVRLASPGELDPGRTSWRRATPSGGTGRPGRSPGCSPRPTSRRAGGVSPLSLARPATGTPAGCGRPSPPGRTPGPG